MISYRPFHILTDDSEYDSLLCFCAHTSQLQKFWQVHTVPYGQALVDLPHSVSRPMVVVVRDVLLMILKRRKQWVGSFT